MNYLLHEHIPADKKVQTGVPLLKFAPIQLESQSNRALPYHFALCEMCSSGACLTPIF